MAHEPGFDEEYDVEVPAPDEASAGSVESLVDDLIAEVDDLVEHLMGALRSSLPQRYRGWLGDDDWDEMAAWFIPAVLACVRDDRALPAAEMDKLRAGSHQRYQQGFPLVISLLAIRAGVAAFGRYVLRKAGVQRLSAAVVVLGRLAVLSHDTSRAVSAAYGPTPGGPPRAAPEIELAPVPRRILELAALGRPTREIARELHYSEQAVTYHLGRMMKQFQAPNRTALIALAVQRGVVALPEPRDPSDALSDCRTPG